MLRIFVIFAGAFFWSSCGGQELFNTTIIESTTIISSPCDGFNGMRIANKTDPTCRTYLLCAFNYDIEEYESWTLICPGELVFRPLTRTCVTNKIYKCPTITT
ncbi:hypothetical protein PV325_000800 [Microctonus aethiopoides]|uniref:Chitin-binding type-2 domain-containing protein n=1 Tax=Microctonus aethiopoides TaxID=144406 RepID=A0AA39F8Z0_9HYME|nr:hypothetical protein PV325_000800 [Microctonus aethiopoides]KAK0092736.1 hypothetical protein PV326_000715 [Microctonus aethiopoides]KAK0165088.1 hypothetical protein PV328_003639 [Microctonus aethiopoides]